MSGFQNGEAKLPSGNRSGDLPFWATVLQNGRPIGVTDQERTMGGTRQQRIARAWATIDRARGGSSHELSPEQWTVFAHWWSLVNYAQCMKAHREGRT